MKKYFLLLTLMLLTTVSSYGAFATFTLKTVGASDTTKVVDLSNPQKDLTGVDICANSLTTVDYVDALKYKLNGFDALTATGTSIFIGRNTKALEDGSTNEVVIGYDAIGAGDNSVTIGSDSIQVTNLTGDLKVKTGAYTRLRTDEVFELPNDGEATSAVDFLIGLNAELGCLKVYDREGVAVAAEYYFSSSATVKAWGDAKFTTTEDNPGTVNIFKSATIGTPIVIQNKTGSVVSIGMLWFGAE